MLVNTWEANDSLCPGASSGIGAATAYQLAIEGAHLIVTGRNEENLAKVAKRCYDDCWNKPTIIPGDLTDEEDVRQIVEASVSCYNRLDVLINNAGVIEMGSIENTSLDQLDRVMKTNVR